MWKSLKVFLRALPNHQQSFAIANPWNWTEMVAFLPKLADLGVKLATTNPLATLSYGLIEGVT